MVINLRVGMMMRLTWINLLTAGLLLCPFPAWSQAEDKITVEYLAGRLVDDACYVDARINFDLHDDFLEALNHGVELKIDIIIRVKEKRDWLWDRLYKRDVLKFRLDHHPLSKVYIVTNTNKSEQRQFDMLENALKYLGVLDNYLLLNSEHLNTEAHLEGSLKVRLRLKSLPPPLKPIAFLFGKSESDSKWRRWTIRP